MVDSTQQQSILSKVLIMDFYLSDFSGSSRICGVSPKVRYLISFLNTASGENAIFKIDLNGRNDVKSATCHHFA